MYLIFQDLLAFFLCLPYLLCQYRPLTFFKTWFIPQMFTEGLISVGCWARCWGYKLWNTATEYDRVTVLKDVPVSWGSHQWIGDSSACDRGTTPRCGVAQSLREALPSMGFVPDTSVSWAKSTLYCDHCRCFLCSSHIFCLPTNRLYSPGIIGYGLYFLCSIFPFLGELATLCGFTCLLPVNGSSHDCSHEDWPQIFEIIPEVSIQMPICHFRFPVAPEN